jgi:hypothetical protein
MGHHVREAMRGLGALALEQVAMPGNARAQFWERNSGC